MANEVPVTEKVTTGGPTASNQGGWRPVPDPTVLTTEALTREIQHVRSEIGHIKELVTIQVGALTDDLDKFVHNHDEKHATVVARSVEHLKELCNVNLVGVAEKFNGIQLQFSERDTRTEQAFKAANEAITAAMAAQEKAIDKSEIAVAKQIDEVKVTLAQSIKGIENQLDDLKERVVRAEGNLTGERQTREVQVQEKFGSNQVAAIGISALFLIVSVVALIVTFVGNSTP